MSEHLARHQIAGFDALAVGPRNDVLAHVSTCGACRAAWLAEDGSRLFALLVDAPIPEDKLERLSARVEAAVERLDLPLPARRRWFGAASLAASLLLAGVLGTMLWIHDSPAGGLARLDEIGVDTTFDNDFAGIELVSSPSDDARVLDLNIGETQVLMIFDESIKL